MPRALISVSDKRGIVAFAQGLVQLGWEIISTGGTAAALRSAGVEVVAVEDVTGFPELLDGRVKTLHPAIHGALLARRDLPAHMTAIAEHGIVPIELVAVNLYPFQMTISRPGVSFEDAVENIDVGGPSMLRSAAKNHEYVLPVVDPTDYGKVLELLRRGPIEPAARREFAAKVFAHTADYDAAIAGFLTAREDALPQRLGISMERLQTLRYGENPGQRAALYVTEEPRGMRDLTQRQGKELSFNNLLDIDAAMAAVACWPTRPACSVIKHTTPCGIAVASTALDAFRKARATDPVSAFGSVVAFYRVVDRAMAEAMSDLFVEVVVAPSFHDEAVAQFAGKKNLRVVELPVSRGAGALDFKRVRGGFLVQDQFEYEPDRPGRDGHRHRRRSDEPGGQRLPRGAQGTAAGTRPGRQRAGFGRLLSLRRRRGAGRRRRCHRDHPAGRLRPRRPGDRGRQSPRNGDGDDRPPAIPPLTPDL